MALLPIVTTSQNQKQITLSLAASGTLYTVPTGKTCIGFFIGAAANNATMIVNSISTMLTQSATNYPGPGVVGPVTLVAGTVITGNGGGSGMFLGIEQ